MPSDLTHYPTLSERLEDVKKRLARAKSAHSRWQTSFRQARVGRLQTLKDQLANQVKKGNGESRAFHIAAIRERLETNDAKRAELDKEKKVLLEDIAMLEAKEAEIQKKRHAKD